MEPRSDFPNGCMHTASKISFSSSRCRPMTAQKMLPHRFGWRLATVLTGSLVVLVTAGKAVANLVEGDEGAEVAALQDCLRSAGYFNQDSTGYFGPITQDAVTTFQGDHGLEVDGIAGENTLSALGCGGRSAQVNYGNAPSSYSGQYQPVNATRPDSFSSSASNSSNRKRYVVVVPTSRPAKASTLLTVQRYIPGAFQVDSPLGSYVQAGSFPDRNFAESRSRYLRGVGLDAQVRYF